MLYDYIFMWNLKNKTNEQTQQNRADSYIQRKKWWLPEGRGVGGQMK